MVIPRIGSYFCPLVTGLGIGSCVAGTFIESVFVGIALIMLSIVLTGLSVSVFFFVLTAVTVPFGFSLGSRGLRGLATLGLPSLSGIASVPASFFLRGRLGLSSCVVFFDVAACGGAAVAPRDVEFATPPRSADDENTGWVTRIVSDASPLLCGDRGADEIGEELSVEFASSTCILSASAAMMCRRGFAVMIEHQKTGDAPEDRERRATRCKHSVFRKCS